MYFICGVICGTPTWYIVWTRRPRRQRWWWRRRKGKCSKWKKASDFITNRGKTTHTINFIIPIAQIFHIIGVGKKEENTVSKKIHSKLCTFIPCIYFHFLSNMLSGLYDKLQPSKSIFTNNIHHWKIFGLGWIKKATKTLIPLLFFCC